MDFEPFKDREDGARHLARELVHHRGNANAIVLGLPRGGVVTASVVAEELGLPLDVLVIRKLGTPGHEELAMGAIGASGVRVLNDDVIFELGITQHEIDAVTERQQAEAERRERLFRGDRAPLDVAGKDVILVDDGLATGATMAAAIDVVRLHGAARVIVAVPVAPQTTCARLRPKVDKLVCVAMPEPFAAVGFWYQEFEQVTDEEVMAILRRTPAAV